MATAWEEFISDASEQTFDSLCRQQGALVWTICRRVLRDEEDARDAFQATFARLAALARTPAGLWEPGLSLGRLAAREADALRHRRNRRWRREVPMDDHADVASAAVSPDEEIARRELRARLEVLTGLLPDRQRVPLQLHHLHGMTHREIGEALNLETSTVAKRVAKGLAILRRRAERMGLRDALVGLGAGAFAVGLLEPPASAADPAALWSSAAPPVTLTATAGLSLLAKGAIAAAALLIGGVAVSTFIGHGEESAPDPAPAGVAAAASGIATPAEEPAGISPGDGPRPSSIPIAADLDAWSSLIEGRVTDEGGSPIGGAVVEAHEPGWTDRLLAAATTDAQGHYRIADVHRSVPGGGNSASVSVRAQCPGFAAAVRETQIHESAAAQRIDFRLLRSVGGVSGRVVNASGETVAGAMVRATSASDESAQVRVLADEAGRFAIDALPAGSVALAAAPPQGVLECLGSWPVGGEDIELRLTRRVGVVRGTITGVFTGAPQAGIRLQLDGETEAVTDTQGHFRFDHLPLGCHRIQWAPGGETYGGGLSLTEIEPECVWDQPLAEETPISGLVCDAETDQPVPGVRIRVMGSDPARAGEGVTDDGSSRRLRRRSSTALSTCAGAAVRKWPFQPGC